MNISEEVEKIYPFLVSTRKYLHEHPESSLKEYETSKFIKQELDKINIDYVTVGETGVLAEIKGKNAGKTIFLRADMDALEMNDAKDADYKSKNQGLNHACGHDAHTAALLGATKILATYPAHSEKFDIDEEALKIACQFHINVALEYLK